MEGTELKVVAYKNGKIWAEDIMKTTGKAAGLAASTDRTEIIRDGKDLVFVTVRIEDKNGLPVPRSNNQLYFSIEGPGKIIATDNGDATSHESFQSKSKKAYNGLCLAIITADQGVSGKIIIKCESKGLKSTSVAINIAD